MLELAPTLELAPISNKRPPAFILIFFYKRPSGISAHGRLLEYKITAKVGAYLNFG